MRLSHDLPCRFARLVFTFTVAYAWAGGADLTRGQVPAPATAQPPARTAEQRAAAAQQLRNSLRAIEAADRDMPRDTFEVAAVVKAVGNDPGKLFEWVRDNTTWVPYRGSLRGDVGVLMDRLGNSLDRSLLLASLLKAAGHEARLARGTLTPEQAEQALPRIRAAATQPNDAAATTLPAATPPSAGANAAPGDDALSAAARTYQIDERRCRDALERLAFRHRQTQETMAERVASQVPRLTELLLPADAPQVKAAVDSAARDAREALRDHWWVQRSDGGRWIDLDPLHADSKPGDRVAPPAAETFEPQKLPPETACEVELRVVVERWEGGAAREATLLRHALRPSQLLGKRVSLSNMPMDWPTDFQLVGQADLPARIGRAAAEQREWVPVLSIDGQITTQSSVKETGEVVAKPEMDSAKRAGKATKSRFDQAFDVLGTDPPAAPTAPSAAPSHLTAQWIEYETRMPGRPTHVVRREIFDLFGPAARAGEAGLPEFNLTNAGRRERALGMMAETEILALPCRLSDAFAFHLFAKAMLTNGPVLATLLADEPRDPKVLDPLLRRLSPMPGPLLAMAMLRQESPVAAQVYVDQPQLLTLRQLFRPAAQSGGGGTGAPGDAVAAFQAFDIVNNDVGVHRWADMRPAAVRVIQGVVDTNAEALAMGEVARRANAGDALAAAEERGESWVALRPAIDGARVNELRLDDDARARVRQDLAAGHTILGPTAVANGAADNSTWWRVDPVTGRTLGIGDKGWGATLVERALIAFAVGYSFGVTGCVVGMAAGNEGTPKNLFFCLGMGVATGLVAAGAFLGINALTGSPGVGGGGGGPVAAAGAGGAAGAFG